MFRVNGWHRRFHLPSLRTSIALLIASGFILTVTVMRPFRVADAQPPDSVAAGFTMEPTKRLNFRGLHRMSETETERMELR